MNLSALKSLVRSKPFERLIVIAVVLNAIVLGVETSPALSIESLAFLERIDLFFVALFTVEIVVKLIAFRTAFFKSGWNIFDLIIVTISLLPFLQGFSVLRALRVLRVLRLVSVVPQFKKVTQAFFDSLAGLTAIGFILSLLFYIGAVMSTKLFGESFPEWFGTIGASLYSLFQIMTLESWSSAIARPVMEVYPYAWAFFVPFILLTTFAAVNLLIGVIVNSMQGVHEETVEELGSHMNEQDRERKTILDKVTALEEALGDLKRKL